MTYTYTLWRRETVRLTHERVNGIKSGYWSPATKDELIARLGPIEELGPELVIRTCAELCRRQAPAERCELCPLRKLGDLIDGVGD